MRAGKSFWFDLPVSNLLDAMAFYEALLDWKFVRMGEPAQSDYIMIQAGDSLIGGLRKVSPGPDPLGPGTGPILYFTVEELEPKIIRAKELGAALVGGKVDLGNERGRYQWLKDRENNLIALWAAR